MRNSYAINPFFRKGSIFPHVKLLLVHSTYCLLSDTSYQRLTLHVDGGVLMGKCLLRIPSVYFIQFSNIVELRTVYDGVGTTFHRHLSLPAGLRDYSGRIIK